MNWTERLSQLFRTSPLSASSRRSKSAPPRNRRVAMEPLEDRCLLSVSPAPELAGAAGEYDFGDAPDNYGTTLAANAAYHEAVGPTLGSTRDAESDGLPTTTADGDDADGTDDEDGMTFGTIQVGQLDATVTVNVQNVTTTAYLDAWIDFNGDGSFGGAGEHIAASVSVSEGDNVIEFEVPSSTVSGEVYARFRLSTDGGLGWTGAAADGEVEDYAVTVLAPTASAGEFASEGHVVVENSGAPSGFGTDVGCYAADVDIDVICISNSDDVISWYENQGVSGFVAHTIAIDHSGLFVADLDGDGDVDVLSCQVYPEDGFTWFKNDGSGNFTAEDFSFQEMPTDYFIAAADINADGDQDFMCWDEDNIYFLSYEDGEISYDASSPSDGAWDATIGDLDGDGDIDIIWAGSQTTAIFLLTNDGLGNFAISMLPDLPASSEILEYKSVSLGDVDSDGDMDLVSYQYCMSTEYEGWELAWHENDGEENFTSHVVGAVSSPSDRFLADMDGDGDLDILANGEDGALSWYGNDGAGNFTACLVGSSSVIVTDMLAADMDGDGDLDVLAVTSDGGDILWYENETTDPADYGDAPDSYGTLYASDGAWHVDVGPTLGTTRDAESDGLPTTAADGDDADGTNDEDGVTFGTIQVGQLDATVTVNVQNVTTTAYLDAWIDFDSDGSFGGADEHIAASVSMSEGDNMIEFDVPSTAVSGEGYARFRLSTDGDLAPSGAAADGEVEDYAVTVSSASPLDSSSAGIQVAISSADANRVVAADLDEDGDVDLAVSGDTTITWFENVGSGSYTSHTVATLSSWGELPGYGAIVAADVNGDGHIDLVSAENDRLLWFENDGSGIFTEHAFSTSWTDFFGFAGVAVADINLDGHMDLLYATYDSLRLVWCENDGNENFTEHPNVVGTVMFNSIDTADVDGDGDVDILYSSLVDDTFGWLENDGTGSFSDHSINEFSAWEYASASIVAADVNGDGTMDVVAAKAGLDTVTWYENDGSQNLTAHVLSTSSGGVSSVYVADLDGDGDMDIFSAAESDDTVTWFENDGSANFTAKTITSSADGACSVTVADVNGDGSLELIWAASESGEIAWYGTTPPADYGDAPDTYGTTFESNGARHEPAGPTLGASRDVDTDGSPSAAADGDDTTGSDDEDGVTLSSITVGRDRGHGHRQRPERRERGSARCLDRL